MKIEVLYPEICKLYGEGGNLTYMQASLDSCEIIETNLNDSPAFIEGEVDLVYMGTMTENSQKLAIDKLSTYTDKIKKSIEKGQHFLVTGNAVEIFGKEIIDKDMQLVENGKDRVKGLGIFDYHTERYMMHRFNCLYVGKYEDLDVVGYKSQFSYSFYDKEIEPLFITSRGKGFNPQTEKEGIHYKNFMGTYVIGPLLILNPDFMKRIMCEIGQENVKPAFYEEAEDAYRARLKEYNDPDTGLYY